MRWESWALNNLEQNEGIPSSQEEGWRRMEEVRRIWGLELLSLGFYKGGILKKKGGLLKKRPRRV